MTTTPEIYNYILWRAGKENATFSLTVSFFKKKITRGVRMFFGALVDNNGTVLDDTRNPGFLDEFRNK